MLSIIALINEKFREAVEPWACFHTREEAFPAFFGRALELRLGGTLSLPQMTLHTVFLTRCYASLEDSMVRAACLRLKRHAAVRRRHYPHSGLTLPEMLLLGNDPTCNRF